MTQEHATVKRPSGRSRLDTAFSGEGCVGAPFLACPPGDLGGKKLRDYIDIGPGAAPPCDQDGGLFCSCVSR
jgi:hypothetical protein